LKNKKLWIAIGWLIFLFILLLTPGNNLPKEPKLFPSADKVVHFTLFLLLIILWGGVVGDLKKNWGKQRGLLVIGIIGITLAIGLENLQKYVPHRSFDWGDMSVNLLGVITGLIYFYTKRKKTFV
jgi:VanZ family protein